MSKLYCKNCHFENEYTTKKQTFKNGSVHIRAECKRCNSFIKYLPQSDFKTYIPFGKYKGNHTYQVSDVEYLQWLWEVVKDKRLADGIDKRIKELTGGCGNG